MEWDKTMGPKLERGCFGSCSAEGESFHLGMALVRWFARKRSASASSSARQPVRSFFRASGDKMTKGREVEPASMAPDSANRALLQVVILPYEEPGCLESARLKDCPVSFVCEHPETGEIDLIPFCAYFVHKNDILRKSAARWQKAEATA